MSIVPLPLSPDAEARALLHHVLEHGDVVGRDSAGRTIIQLSVDGWVLEKLMAFDAEAAELEDGGETEPDADAEEDGPPGVVELARPRVIRLELDRCPACHGSADLTERRGRGQGGPEHPLG